MFFSISKSAIITGISLLNNCITTFDLIATNDQTINIVKPLLPYIDYFMPSIEEAIDLSNIKDPKDIKDLEKKVYLANYDHCGPCGYHNPKYYEKK